MTDAVKTQIGRRLREKREQAGYTREQLGELCSLSPRFLANIELGDSTFSLDSLMTICRVLSCSSDYLLYGRSVDAGTWMSVIRPALTRYCKGWWRLSSRRNRNKTKTPLRQSTESSATGAISFHAPDAQPAAQMSWISTGALPGSVPRPMAARAAEPASPSSSVRSSDPKSASFA